MFCHPKPCPREKSVLEKMSTAAMLTGGLLATAYFGYRRWEKLKGKCCCHAPEDPICPPDTASHDTDHISENDCLCHSQKDYYGQCGCLGNAEEND